jgi:hypothetical protein
MNTPTTAQVPAKSSRQFRIFPVLLLLCSLGYVSQGIQCVGINGGASELTWSLRTFQGESSDCAKSKISKVRLCWNALDEGESGCRPGSLREFDCIEETGVTLFEIPPGRTRFSVEPVCLDGQPAIVGTYQVPPEIVRTVRDGEVVTLDALLIVVSDPDTCTGANCTCVRP